MVPAWSQGSRQGWEGPGEGGTWVGVARVGVARLAAFSPIILFDLHILLRPPLLITEETKTQKGRDLAKVIQKTQEI